MEALFEKLCRRLLPGSDRHVADRAMADLLCGETSLLKRWAALHHISKCSYCRIRKVALEGPRAERMIEMYGETIPGEDVRLHQESRGEFANWIETQLLLDDPRLRRPRHGIKLPTLKFKANIPALSLGLALGAFVGAAGLHLWWLKGVSHITANALLVRAEKWDTIHASSTSAVAYQAIQIKAPQGVVKRSLYRDLQARRWPKSAPPIDKEAKLREEELRSNLDRAGVDWEQPLSATSYQAWHDRQHERADRIVFAEHHLLTLTTTVPQGEIFSETLTVRETDFHPVRRAIDFRDQGTVEIAELDFRVLPWSAVDANAFEPIIEHPRPSALALPPGRAPLEPLPTPEQLDETELTARLVLNQLHADSGEQIEIRRTSREVEVDGLVETDERKRELRTQLMVVPGLKVSIHSATDAKNASASGPVSAQVESAFLPDSPSALEIYLRARGRSIDETNATSSQFLREALIISRESQALAGLGTRFASRGSRPTIVSVTVTDLLYSHRERLKTVLLEQHLLLDRTEGVQSRPDLPTSDLPVADETLLRSRAALDLTLIKELTQTNTPPPRNAEAIFVEINATLDSLDAAAGELYAKYQQAPAATGRN
jgi:hypothetical protein